MGNFDAAIEGTLRNEGGAQFTNGTAASPNDPPTKYGITLNTLTDWRGRPCEAEDVANLGEYEARAIYKARYWTPMMCDAILSQRVASKVFDMAVNMGVRRVSRFLQEVCGAVVDGVLGPMTIEAVNAMSEETAVVALVAIQQSFYARIKASPQQHHEWAIRARYLA